VRLYERLADLADCLRYEDAARLRDRIASLERVIDGLVGLERLRRIETCLLAPAAEPGAFDGWFVAGGRIVTRRTLRRGAAGAEIEAGHRLASEAARAGPSYEPDHLDELLVVGAVLKRPPPELRVLPLDVDRILERVAA
jgi:UvrB/UvrC motif-containing protein